LVSGGDDVNAKSIGAKSIGICHRRLGRGRCGWRAPGCLD